jgi:hypothetical protein
MKAYRVSKSIDPVTLNVGYKWVQVVNVILFRLLNPRVWILLRIENRFGRFGGNETFYLYRDSKSDPFSL